MFKSFMQRREEVKSTYTLSERIAQLKREIDSFVDDVAVAYEGDFQPLVELLPPDFSAGGNARQQLIQRIANKRNAIAARGSRYERAGVETR